ncbi:MAG: tetratricopeptide repeat protein, partial [Dehalococcoidia bacterium]|nr:tetratricopeptide repeat protein [Dehalococcoidia bacterium]
GNLAKRIEGEAEPDTAYVSEGLLDLLDLPLYKVSRIGPRSLRGDHLAKRVLYREHEFDEAVFSARPDLQLTASDWFLRGVAMIGTPQENTDDEAECYEEALRLRPDYAEAHYNYAFLLKERGDLEGAEGHYQEALRLRPDDPKAHYNYAILLKERGDLKGAEGHYQEALRLRPEYAEAHYNYAVLLQERGDLEGAGGQYQEALRLRPDDPEAHYNYAVLLKQCCLPRRSKYHFERAFRLAPDRPLFESAYQRRAWLRDKG